MESTIIIRKKQKAEQVWGREFLSYSAVPKQGQESGGSLLHELSIVQQLPLIFSTLTTHATSQISSTSRTESLK